MSAFTRDIVGITAVYCIVLLAIIGAWLTYDYLNKE